MNRLLLVSSGLWCLGAVAMAQAENFALVVGVDKYKDFNSLDGAVNDAKVVAEALKSAGVKHVITLVNDQASRNNIKNAWDEISKQAKTGDSVYLSYAGHGSQLPERIKGSETDGLDEFYVLGKFAESGKNTFERIVDDDLWEWFGKRPDLNIVLISDSCHSGTMTRAYQTSKLKRRRVTIKGIQQDALPLPANPQMVDEQKNVLTHVISISGVHDNEEVPEVRIENTPHGALSWFFAKGILGEADFNRDGAVSLSELKPYLNEKVKMQTEGIQHPEINFINDRELFRVSPNKAISGSGGTSLGFAVVNISGNDTAVNFVLANLKNVATTDKQNADLFWDVDKHRLVDKNNNIVAAFAGSGETTTRGYKRLNEADAALGELLTGIQTAVDGYRNKQSNVTKTMRDIGQGALALGIKADSNQLEFANSVLKQLSGYKVADKVKASLEWDVGNNLIRNEFSDVVYHFSKDDGQTRGIARIGKDDSLPLVKNLQGVINKYRLVESFKCINDGSLAVRLLPDDKLHKKGDKLAIQVEQIRNPFLTVFNLAVDGTLNFLYPVLQTDILQIPLDRPYKIDDLEVTEPFGGDHFVVILSDHPLLGLHKTLKSIQDAGAPATDALKQVILEELSSGGYQLGILPSFTANVN
ncbi:caspase family protein [Methylomonas paludis]|uniref:Caspase family protein n=1 Tax=Methylomonas paludis TaxID=1173101 RepID=A0A975MQY2_9GAMM|nr:caspase family protein [Methylomonas paludis]QWF72367.1 caspase family protein [Methylomonas paludis]